MKYIFLIFSFLLTTVCYSNELTIKFIDGITGNAIENIYVRINSDHTLVDTTDASGYAHFSSIDSCGGIIFYNDDKYQYYSEWSRKLEGPFKDNFQIIKLERCYENLVRPKYIKSDSTTTNGVKIIFDLLYGDFNDNVKAKIKVKNISNYPIIFPKPPEGQYNPYIFSIYNGEGKKLKQMRAVDGHNFKFRDSVLLQPNDEYSYEENLLSCGLHHKGFYYKGIYLIQLRIYSFINTFFTQWEYEEKHRKDKNQTITRDPSLYLPGIKWHGAITITHEFERK